MNSLTNFNYNGQTIQKREDGFINLTQMCHANGKRLDVFMKAKKTKEYIEELQSLCSEKSVLDAKEGGHHSGTWGHPSIAVKLASWISPVFEAWINFYVISPINWIEYFSPQQETTNELEGFVYLIKCQQYRFYKIGMSKNPYKRMQSLQVATPYELTVMSRVFSFNCPMLEESLHDYYSAYWMRGEWFDFPDEVVSEFEEVATSLDQKLEVKQLEGVNKNV